MWLSSKRYDALWETKDQLQKEKDTLIRLLSGIVISQGGEITIPIPSHDSRTLQWNGHDNGSVTIKSKICNLEKGKLNTQ